MFIYDKIVLQRSKILRNFKKISYYWPTLQQKLTRVLWAEIKEQYMATRFHIKNKE